jgi:uncharacterized damage-inducible protein DinB
MAALRGARLMLKNFVDEYHRYKLIGKKALDQTSDLALNKALGHENNSIAMIVRHISGNFVSRFTDFLTSDGEKPWRNRDTEFESRDYDRQEIYEMWDKGWEALETQLSALSDDDLERTVYIRGQSWTVHAALSRSLAHVSYHIGQIVMLARMLNEGEWKWISVPKGKSKEYNLNPTKERRPDGANL